MVVMKGGVESSELTSGGSVGEAELGDATAGRSRSMEQAKRPRINRQYSDSENSFFMLGKSHSSGYPTERTRETTQIGNQDR